MNILILDDDAVRHQAFDNYYRAYAPITHTYRYSDCIKNLKLGGWDIVHLDHDLGEEIGDPDMRVDGWGKAVQFNGLDVVRWLVDRVDEPLALKIIVHSMNPAGGQKMYDELCHAGFDADYIPFVEVYSKFLK